jgi:hypothetical protein
MNGPRIPLKLRLVWWLMVKAERVAQWCRQKWLKHHENHGAILPGPPEEK